MSRWGVRLLCWLGVAFLGVLISSFQHAYSVLTLAMLLAGLVGAAWCTTAGLRAMYRVPPDRRARGRSRDA